MSATLDYDLKKAMPFLAKEHRWDVLTTLILHANIRNRCFPSMETITEMATNGNRNKATSAKKWLEKHGAFELVPYSKRVAEELKLKPRQHVYQLLGVIQACADATCDCGHNGAVYHYLYFGKSIDGHTFENLNGDTFESIDGHTLSIPKEVFPKEDISPNGKSEKISSSQMNPMKDALAKVFTWDWQHMTKGEKGLIQVTAKELCSAGYMPEDIPSMYKYCKERFTNISPRALATHASEWRVSQVPQKKVIEKVPFTPLLQRIANESNSG